MGALEEAARFVLRAIVGVLVLLRLLSTDGGRAPRKRLSPAPPSRPPVHTKRLVWCLEIALLGLAATASFAAGWHLRPQADPSPSLPASVTVELPVAAADANGLVPVTHVIWAESRGQGQDPYVWPPPKQLPLIPSADTTRVSLFLVFERAFTTPADFEIRVNIPESAELVGCESPFGKVRCSVTKYMELRVFGPGQPERAITITPEPSGFFMMGATFDITSPSALSFASAGQETLVRFPALNLLLGGSGGPSLPPFEVQLTAGYAIPGGERMRWTTTPARSEGFTIWSFSVSDRSPMPPSTSTGVDQRAVERESNETFYSGAVLGLGGGFLVALLQLILRWPKRGEEDI